MTTFGDPTAEAVADVAERLMHEFADVVPPATVAAMVLHARRDLDGHGQPASAEALERQTRIRLGALVQDS